MFLDDDISSPYHIYTSNPKIDWNYYSYLVLGILSSHFRDWVSDQFCYFVVIIDVYYSLNSSIFTIMGASWLIVFILLVILLNKQH